MILTRCMHPGPTSVTVFARSSTRLVPAYDDRGELGWRRIASVTTGSRRASAPRACVCAVHAPARAAASRVRVVQIGAFMRWWVRAAWAKASSASSVRSSAAASTPM